MESKDQRQHALLTWLHEKCLISLEKVVLLAGDASFRRYFRIEILGKSFIAMDAPPALEPSASFIAIAKALQNLGLRTPEILHADLNQGFLLLSDFGDATFIKILHTQNAEALYTKALQTLSILQCCASVPNMEIPVFSPAFMQQEWQWHKVWFLQKLLGLSLDKMEKKLDALIALIIEAADKQPKVFMHRDYHAANLMQLQDKAVGILDFQDAVMGPVTYDLVSLLRDCYINWPEKLILKLTEQYRLQLKDLNVLSAVISEDDFIRWFDWMGLQRHLKALFIFARKHVRDQQSRYLSHIPRTINYVCEVSTHYPEFSALHDFYQDIVQPAFNLKYAACVQ